jgi:hypothetical protein
MAKANFSPEERRARSERLRRQWQDPEFRRAQSERLTARNADPAFRRTQREAMKAWNAANGRRHSAFMKTQWTTVGRRRHSAFMKTQWTTVSPEMKTRQLAAMQLAARGKQPSGPDHWKWNGGLRISYGYRELRTGRRYRAEHRVIAERALGRRLLPDECVHHWNENRADNRAANLLICTRAYHRWLHAKIERMAREREKWV